MGPRLTGSVRPAMFAGMPIVPPDPLLMLLLALVIDAAIGDPPIIYRHVPHPVALLGRVIAFFDRRLNRETRGENERRVRGALVVVVVVVLAAAVGWAVHELALAWRWGWVVEVIAATMLLAQRSLYDHVREVAGALGGGGLAAGRIAVARIVGRDPQSLDEHGVCRAAIESLFENFADGVVAPVFWFVLLGLPGMAAAKAINTLDSMLGHMTPRYRAFGEAAARLDTAMNYVPARIAGFVIIAATAAVPGGSPATALRVMWRDASKHRSVNAGWPEAAAAGALTLTLAGPRRYGDIVLNDPWLGDGRARAVVSDIYRALYLYLIACGVLAALIAVLAMIRT
jgi:adenosylcobinamide-phosphate synthase